MDSLELTEQPKVDFHELPWSKSQGQGDAGKKKKIRTNILDFQVKKNLIFLIRVLRKIKDSRSASS